MLIVAQPLMRCHPQMPLQAHGRLPFHPGIKFEYLVCKMEIKDEKDNKISLYINPFLGMLTATTI